MSSIPTLVIPPELQKIQGAPLPSANTSPQADKTTTAAKNALSEQSAPSKGWLAPVKGLINKVRRLCGSRPKSDDDIEMSPKLTLSSTKGPIKAENLNLGPGLLTLGATNEKLVREPVFIKREATVIWGNFRYKMWKEVPDTMTDAEWLALTKDCNQVLGKIPPNNVFKPGINKIDLIPKTGQGIEAVEVSDAIAGAPNAVTRSKYDIPDTKEVADSILQKTKKNDPLSLEKTSLSNTARPPSSTSKEKPNTAPAALFEKTSKSIQAKPDQKTPIIQNEKISSIAVVHPKGHTNAGNLCYLNSSMAMLEGNPYTLGTLLEATSRTHPIHKTLSEYADAQKNPNHSTPLNAQPIRAHFSAPGRHADASIPSSGQEDADRFLRIALDEISPPQSGALSCRQIVSYNTPSGESKKEVHLASPFLPPAQIRANKDDPSHADFNSILYTSMHYGAGGATIRINGQNTQVQEFHYKFPKAPPTLFGQIARFRPDGTKDTTLLKKCSLEYILPSTSTEDGQAKTYDLVSFNVHTGDRINSGHYITYLRTFGKTEKEDKYWEINDSTASLITKAQFEAQMPNMYLFNHNRRDITEEIRRKSQA